MFDATRYGPLASFDAGIARQLYDLLLLTMSARRALHTLLVALSCELARTCRKKRGSDISPSPSQCPAPQLSVPFSRRQHTGAGGGARQWHELLRAEFGARADVLKLHRDVPEGAEHRHRSVTQTQIQTRTHALLPFPAHSAPGSAHRHSYLRTKHVSLLAHTERAPYVPQSNNMGSAGLGIVVGGQLWFLDPSYVHTCDLFRVVLCVVCVVWACACVHVCACACVCMYAYARATAWGPYCTPRAISSSRNLFWNIDMISCNLSSSALRLASANFSFVAGAQSMLNLGVVLAAGACGLCSLCV